MKDFTVIIGLHTQVKICAVTDKNATNTTQILISVGITLHLTHKIGHQYYSGPPHNELLFSMIELAQIDWNLSHPPPGSI